MRAFRKGKKYLHIRTKKDSRVIWLNPGFMLEAEQTPGSTLSIPLNQFNMYLPKHVTLKMSLGKIWKYSREPANIVSLFKKLIVLWGRQPLW